MIPAPDIVGAAQQISQNPLTEYARATQLGQEAKQFQQQQQARAQEIEMRRRQLADQDALTKTLSQYDPNKHTLADIPHMVTQNGGSGQAALNAQKGLIESKSNLLKMSDEDFAHQQKINDLTQGIHDQVTAAPPDKKQVVYQNGLAQLHANGVDVSNEPLQYPGDEAFAQHLPAIRLHSGLLAESEKDRELKAKESEAATRALTAQTSAQRLQAELPGGALEDVSRAEMHDWLKKNPGKGPSDFLAWKAKQTPTAIIMGNQLGGGGAGSALDQAAERYYQSGELPSGLMRSPGSTVAILRRAAELHPDANVAANKTILASQKKALGDLQSQFSKVSAFENTAGKNLDLFLKQAENVTDLGAKFADMPIRMVQRDLLGTADIAAFDAARTTALTEIAKVLNSPTGAGVLSDSARKEAESLIGPNATLNSIKSAANILRQDMRNRHDSYADEIKNLQGMIQKPGSEGGGERKMYQGVPYEKQPDGSWKKAQ